MSGATLTPEQLYAFDTMGYLHIPLFLSAEQIEQARSFLTVEAEKVSADTGIERWSDLHKKFPSIQDLVCSQHVVGPVLHLINQPLRIVECYGHRSGEGSFLYMHNGSTQDQVYEGHIRATRNMAYRCEYHDGRLYTTFVKVLLYLTDIPEDGGPFCYVEGSHKANFSFPWPDDVRSGRRMLSESGHAAVRKVPVCAGDAIFLNEALFHGAAMRRRDGVRALLAVSFCPSFMADWRYLTRDAGDLESVGYPDLDDEGDFFDRSTHGTSGT
jgi:ectoine hydroxylase-related dioxygenase (phytanoyl-CoA dioxygenase family)